MRGTTIRVGVLETKHIGRAKAIDLTIKKTSGEFIVLLDSDDWLDPKCLEELAFSSDHFDMIFGNHIEHNQGSEHPESPSFEHSLDSAIDILFNPGVYFHPCLFSRKIYDKSGGVNKDLVACIDLELYLRMFGAAGEALKKPSAIYHYRKHLNQMGVTNQRDQRAIYRYLVSSYTAHLSEIR